LRVHKPPANKLLMLGSVITSKLGVIGSPVVITSAFAMSEVYRSNFWVIVSIFMAIRSWGAL